MVTRSSESGEPETVRRTRSQSASKPGFARACQVLHAVGGPIDDRGLRAAHDAVRPRRAARRPGPSGPPRSAKVTAPIADPGTVAARDTPVGRDLQALDGGRQGALWIARPVLDVGAVDVGTTDVVGDAELEGDGQGCRDRLVGGADLAEAGQRHAERVEAVALEVARADGPGRGDGFLAQRAGLARAGSAACTPARGPPGPRPDDAAAPRARAHALLVGLDAGGVVARDPERAPEQRSGGSSGAPRRRRRARRAPPGREPPRDGAARPGRRPGWRARGGRRGRAGGGVSAAPRAGGLARTGPVAMA